MHDSITIAEVGVMLNVRGSRMATPLAPPRPGRTPMSTPRMMPTNIRRMFIGVRITPNPWKRALSSTILFVSGFGCEKGSVAQEGERVQRSLEQRDLEPDFEHEEEQGEDHHGNDHALEPGVVAQVHHEAGDVDRG